VTAARGRGVERRGAMSRAFFFSRGIGETPSGLSFVLRSRTKYKTFIPGLLGPWPPLGLPLASPCLHKFKVTLPWLPFVSQQPVSSAHPRAPSRTLAHPRAVCGPLFALVARFPSHTHPSNSNFPKLMQPSTSRDTGFPACN
jgi:hypothetical protein